MDLREKFIGALQEERIPCSQLEVKPYRDTLWRINNRSCYITYRDDVKPWFQVPASVLDEADVLIFIADSGNSVDLPRPFLISAEDFRLLTGALVETPTDGAYNVHIMKYDWPNIDLRVSLGDRSQSVSGPYDDSSDANLVFDTFELLENDDDDPSITSAFRRVEDKIRQQLNGN